MIKRLPRVVFTFRTTTDVMALERLCRERGMPGRVIPVPGAITADCGLAWCAEPEQEPVLLALLEGEGIPFQGVYHLLV